MKKQIGTYLGRQLYKPDNQIHVLHDVAYYDML